VWLPNRDRMSCSACQTGPTARSSGVDDDTKLRPLASPWRWEQVEHWPALDARLGVQRLDRPASPVEPRHLTLWSPVISLLASARMFFCHVLLEMSFTWPSLYRSEKKSSKGCSLLLCDPGPAQQGTEAKP
jgi:hypothetical protein